MEKLILREITPNDENAVLDYLKEFTEYGSAMKGLGGASSFDTFTALLKQYNEDNNVEFLGYENNQTPRSTFLIVRLNDNRIVGSINFRWKLTKYIDENFIGNIGYCIRPTERRKGYATEALRLGLILCKEKGLHAVRLGCLTDNTGSRKTILKNGGQLIAHKEKLISEDYYEIKI